MPLKSISYPNIEIQTFFNLFPIRFTTSKTASSVKRMNTVLTSLFQVLVIHENIRSLILAEGKIL